MSDPQKKIEPALTIDDLAHENNLIRARNDRLEKEIMVLQAEVARWEWVKPILFGDSIGDRRAAALAGGLMMGLDGSDAVDQCIRAELAKANKEELA